MPKALPSEQTHGRAGTKRGRPGARAAEDGVALRRGFDVFKEAKGAGRGSAWTMHGLEPDAPGRLDISLSPIRNYACVNAVEVLDESK